MQLSAIAKWSLSAVLVSVATMAVADAQISMGVSSGGGGGSGTVNTGTTNALGYYAAPGTTISPITACANGVYSTNGSSVPGCGTTLPTSLIIPGASSISTGAGAPTCTGGMICFGETTVGTGKATGVDVIYADSTQHGFLSSFNNGSYLPIVQGPASAVSGHLAVFSGINGGLLADGGAVPGGGCSVIGSPTANQLLMDNGSGCPADATTSATVPGLSIATSGTLVVNNSGAIFVRGSIYTTSGGTATGNAVTVIDNGGSFVSQSSGRIGFSSASSGVSALNFDTAISRDSTGGSGIFDFGTGGVNSKAGTLNAANMNLTGATVTLSGLGTATGTPSSLCLNSSTVVVNAALTCTVSNESVKNSFAVLPVGINSLMELKPISFEYNDRPGRTRWGFGAMQVASVNPALADGWREDGNAWSLDQNAILALTVKSLQELKQENDELKQRIRVLEAQ